MKKAKIKMQVRGHLIKKRKREKEEESQSEDYEFLI